MIWNILQITENAVKFNFCSSFVGHSNRLLDRYEHVYTSVHIFVRVSYVSNSKMNVDVSLVTLEGGGLWQIQSIKFLK